MTASRYAVAGMVCQHCASFVTEEIKKIAAVTDVTVDLSSSTVVVTSDAKLDVDDVRAAVDEAGYELIGH